MSELNVQAALPHVTERAAQRVTHILAKEGADAMLRVAVKGGGCSGFQYSFEIVHQTEADDIILPAGTAKVLVDPVSLDFLRGAEIDFIDDLMGQSFRIENPNASSSCGCGTSFAI
jgi:iron-sulfur cluster assembly accessory protein